MAKEKERIEKYDRFDEEVNMTIVFPWEKERKGLDKTSDDFKQEVDEKFSRED